VSQTATRADGRAALITRLTSAEISAHLPPMPNANANAGQLQSTSSATRNSRSISSSATALASKSKVKTEPTPKSPVGEIEAEPVSTDTITSSGTPVASPLLDAPGVATIDPESITVAPGLPETKNVEVTISEDERADLKMPLPKEDAESDQIVVCPLHLSLYTRHS
jgi:hypothetical protein